MILKSVNFYLPLRIYSILDCKDIKIRQFTNHTEVFFLSGFNEINSDQLSGLMKEGDILYLCLKGKTVDLY
jgi:hypothetical protein